MEEDSLIRVEKRRHEYRKYIECFKCKSILSFTKEDQVDSKTICCPECCTNLLIETEGQPLWKSSLEQVKTPNEREVKLKVVRHVSEYDGEESFDYMIECDDYEAGQLDLETIKDIFTNAESVGKYIDWD